MSSARARLRARIVKVADDTEGDVEDRRGKHLRQQGGVPGVGGDRVADGGAGRSCGWGRPGRTHRSDVGAVHAPVTTAGSGSASVLEMSASDSSSPRGSLTSTPVAVAVIEFSHLTKPCASVPQIPAAGWSARGSSVLSGLGARVSARNSQYRSAGTGRAQTLVPASVVSVRRVSRAAATPAISRRCEGEQSGSSARLRSLSRR